MRLLGRHGCPSDPRFVVYIYVQACKTALTAHFRVISVFIFFHHVALNGLPFFPACLHGVLCGDTHTSRSEPGVWGFANTGTRACHMAHRDARARQTRQRGRTGTADTVDTAEGAHRHGRHGRGGAQARQTQQSRHVPVGGVGLGTGGRCGCLFVRVADDVVVPQQVKVGACKPAQQYTHTQGRQVR